MLTLSKTSNFSLYKKQTELPEVPQLGESFRACIHAAAYRTNSKFAPSSRTSTSTIMPSAFAICHQAIKSAFAIKLQPSGFMPATIKPAFAIRFSFHHQAIRIQLCLMPIQLQHALSLLPAQPMPTAPALLPSPAPLRLHAHTSCLHASTNLPNRSDLSPAPSIQGARPRSKKRGAGSIPLDPATLDPGLSGRSWRWFRWL